MSGDEVEIGGQKYVQDEVGQWTYPDGEGLSPHHCQAIAEIVRLRETLDKHHEGMQATSDHLGAATTCDFCDTRTLPGGDD